MKKLIVKMHQKASLFPGTLDMSKVAQVRIWRDFDTFFSAPLNGYRDADDFYEQASAVNYMAGISVPALVLNAQNDPLLSPECSPEWLAATHPHIYLETPRTGGHVGFMVRGDEYTYAERRAFAFVTAPF
jgi:uncharacterized protein